MTIGSSSQCENCVTSLLMDIMWPASQSHFHLSFIFIEMNFHSLSFLCDVCNEVHEHIQVNYDEIIIQRFLVFKHMF